MKRPYTEYTTETGTVFKVTACHRDGTPIAVNEKLELPELKDYLSKLLQEKKYSKS